MIGTQKIFLKIEFNKICFFVFAWKFFIFAWFSCNLPWPIDQLIKSVRIGHKSWLKKSPVINRLKFVYFVHLCAIVGLGSTEVAGEKWCCKIVVYCVRIAFSNTKWFHSLIVASLVLLRFIIFLNLTSVSPFTLNRQVCKL